MKRLLFPALLAALVLAGCGNSNSTGAPGPGTRQDPARPQSALQKLADQPYAASAYLISADTLSADAQKAISGFEMTKKAMPDGTTEVTLKALEPQYHDQEYTLKAGEQLYFIDKFMADDNQGKETNPNDDTAVIVDSQGNVVQGPSNF